MVTADFVAGISAGAVTTLVMHPLDLIKVRLQVDDYYHRAATSAPTSTTIPTNAAANAGMSGRFVRIWRSFTSYKDLYRGLGVNLVGNTVSWGLYFTLYNEFKRQLLISSASSPSGSSPGYSTTATATGEQGPPAGDAQQQHLYLAAALAAGTTTSFLTNPLWVLKTRQLGTTAQEARTSVLAIVRTEGVRSLWRGFVPGLFGVVQGSLQFTIYEDLKQRRLLHHHRLQKRDHDEAARGHEKEGDLGVVGAAAAHNHNRQLPTLEYLSISAASKIAATVLLYPYQLVRSRLQMPIPPSAALPASGTLGGVPVPVPRSRAMDVLRYTMRTEGGLLALYKGLGANLLRVVPSTCITFLVYEKVQLFVNQQQQLQKQKQW